MITLGLGWATTTWDRPTTGCSTSLKIKVTLSMGSCCSKPCRRCELGLVIGSCEKRRMRMVQGRGRWMEATIKSGREALEANSFVGLKCALEGNRFQGISTNKFCILFWIWLTKTEPSPILSARHDLSSTRQTLSSVITCARRRNQGKNNLLVVLRYGGCHQPYAGGLANSAADARKKD